MRWFIIVALVFAVGNLVYQIITPDDISLGANIGRVHFSNGITVGTSTSKVLFDLSFIDDEADITAASINAKFPTTCMEKHAKRIPDLEQRRTYCTINN